ncbi:PcfJ domain-containing protein [uncultured Acetatifactor sp.]|uniref:PcfJ domain-containing protein n=1 Tax=uncultured Acetatifactor sp. TaxID=1671927 RepID=UPI002632DC57|nr:PcfJ domain-containing protein [uncultured Acetatifactor sp.]
MKKKELLASGILTATPKMMKLAESDRPVRQEESYWSGRRFYVTYQYGLYMRCQILGGLLKVAFFFTEHMRTGGKLPAYELYVDKEAGKFLTYDRGLGRWLTAKLDMLPWPASVHHSEKKWISEQGHRLVKDYLGVEHGGYKGLLEYQLKVRADQLKQRHKRETDPWDLDLEQTPDLPKDWGRWVKKVGITENYIFYRYDRKGVKTGYCTFCEKEVEVRKPRHNKAGRCLRCRHAVTYKALGKAGAVIATERDYMYLMQRCEDGFMIREFKGYRRYRKEDYRNPECSSWECRRTIYGHNAEPLHAYYWGDYKHVEARWIETDFCHPYWYGDGRGKVYGKTLPSLGKKELRRTGIMEALKDNQRMDPEKYLAVLQKVPQLEQLSKAHMPALVEECMGSYHGFKEAFKNPESRSLLKLLGIDSQQLKRLRKNRGGRNYLKWLQYEKVMGRVLPDEVVVWFCREGILPERLRFIADRMSMVQIRHYMRRQMRETGMSSQEMLTTWSDYLSMADRLKMDTGDAIIYRARKLRQRHDELVERCGQKKRAIRAGEILKKYPYVEDIFRETKAVYEYVGKGYAVIVPSRIEEIMEEGESLHHCVGSSDRYWERIERGESYVLFLRRASNLKEPYYTLEVEPDGTVRQKRTMYDRQDKDIKDAEKFLREWQKVVARRMTAKERDLAEKSRILRNQEFQQLQEDRVVISMGDLQGQLLADVLMADLMENKERTAGTALPMAA